VIPLRDNVPTRRFPVVTVGLIVACSLVWFWELSGPGVNERVFRNGYYPCTVEGPCRVPFHPLPWYEGAFTGMFMHASWEHILGNMLFLWIFRGFGCSGFATCSSSTPFVYSALICCSVTPCGSAIVRVKVPKRRSNRK
jgi:hypothetical protein